MLQNIHQMVRKLSSRTNFFFFFFILTLSIQTHCCFGVDGSINNYQSVEVITEADTYVGSTAPSTNHGLNDSLQIWRTETTQQLIILRFVLPDIVPDSINSVKLQLQTGAVLTSYVVGVFGCRDISLSETELNYNNFPEYVNLPLDVVNGSSGFQKYSWGISAWVLDELEAAAEKVTFTLRSHNVVTGYGLISFISKEGAENGLGSPPLLIFNLKETTSSSISSLADIPIFSLLTLISLTAGVFFFTTFLFLRRSPSPPSPVLPKKSSKPPPSVEARNDIIFTPFAKKLFETAIEKPVKPVEPELMNLDSEIVPTPKERRSFFCQIDGQKHPAIDSAYECEECSRNVCGSCYESSKAAGIGSCPFCQGRLIRIQ